MNHINLMNKNDGFFVFAELILEKNTLGVFPSYKILSYLLDNLPSESLLNFIILLLRFPPLKRHDRFSYFSLFDNQIEISGRSPLD